MRFHPIYGWGWFQGPGTVTVEVPEAFYVAASSASDRTGPDASPGAHSPDAAVEQALHLTP